MVTIGLDEVGRGCWAGPLVAAAVALDPSRPVVGLRDSKKLSAAQRSRLVEEVQAQALAIGIGWVQPVDVDRLGITTAVKWAMEQAYAAVMRQLQPDTIVGGATADVIVDGNYNFLAEVPGSRTLVGADGIEPSVSAASIVAKVARDTYMQTEAHAAYPLYGFDRHVGYGTALHQAALRDHGVTPLHRRSYKPIRALLVQSES